MYESWLGILAGQRKHCLLSRLLQLQVAQREKSSNRVKGRGPMTDLASLRRLLLELLDWERASGFHQKGKDCELQGEKHEWNPSKTDDSSVTLRPALHSTRMIRNTMDPLLRSAATGSRRME